MRVLVTAALFAIAPAAAQAKEGIQSASSESLTGWERYKGPGWYLIRVDATASDIWRGPYLDEAECIKAADSRNSTNVTGGVPSRYYCRNLSR
jgi:hypothetical protein